LLLQLTSLKSLKYLVLLVKLVGRDLQKRLQTGTAGVVHQQVDGADGLQGRRRGPPVRQVHTHRGDGRTLGEEDEGEEEEQL